MSKQQFDTQVEFNEQFKNLTPRQKEVLTLFLSGYNDEDIAKKLTIAKVTVRKYIENISKIFNLNSEDKSNQSKRGNLIELFKKYKPDLVKIDPLKYLNTTKSRRDPDWGEAIDVSLFFGRDLELSELKKWILDEKCRLVAILAMGGMGKTFLSVKLGKQIENKFSFLIWRSLKDEPPLDNILTDVIKYLSNNQKVDLPNKTSDCISLLIKYLQKHRCLLILDNMESILKHGDNAVVYKEGYEEYGQLIQKVGQIDHKSCLLLTSREQPIGLLQNNINNRCFYLKGLIQEDCQKFFEKSYVDPNHYLTNAVFSKNEGESQKIIEYYGGNPLCLRIVAYFILEVFNGQLSGFIYEHLDVDAKERTLDEINWILEIQFNRLHDNQQQIMYWLAVNREPVYRDDLKNDFVQKSDVFYQDVRYLKWRFLVETDESGKFTQQPVVMQYTIEKLMRKVCDEIKTGELFLLHKIALSKAKTKDYIRMAQFNVILDPIQKQLIQDFGSLEKLESRLKEILSALRMTPIHHQGYAGGNIANLLCCMNVELKNYDFSNIRIWQAYFQGINLHGVNFTNSDLSKSVFTEILGSIWAVAFSPNQGDFLATGDSFNKIHLWKASDDTYTLEKTFEGHTNWIQSLAFSPDGKFLASGSGDQKVKLWNVQTGEFRNLDGHEDWVDAVVFSPDGKILASGSGDKSIRLWNVKTGESLTVLQGHNDRVRSIAFNPDGTILASASEDNTIKLWNIERTNIERTTCSKTLDEHTKTVRGVIFSPDGETIASCSDGCLIKYWNAKTGECIKTLRKHTEEVRTIALSPDGKTLASGGLDSIIRLWDMETGDFKNYLKGHNNAIRSIAFSPDGETLASGSDDNNVRLWNYNKAKSLRVLQGYSRFIQAVAFSPDGQRLVTASEDKTLRLWDTSNINNKENASLVRTFQGHSHWVWSVAFSPDGSQLISCSEDRTIRLWNVRDGKCLRILTGHTSWVQSVCFSPDGQTAASCSYDQTIRIWDIAKGKERHSWAAHNSWVQSVCFSPNGQYLVSCSDDKTVKLWNLMKESPVLELELEEHTNWVWSVAFSPDGKTIASSSADKTVRLWDINDTKSSKVLEGHTKGVRSVAFSPCGKKLATGSDDTTAKIWDLETKKCIYTLEEHTSSVRSVCFHPNEPFLATGSEDEKIKIWDISTGKCIITTGIRRPYEGMNITNVIGITDAQKATLKALGAVEDTNT